MRERPVAEHRRRFPVLPENLQPFFWRAFLAISVACAAVLIGALFWADWKKAFWFDEIFTYRLSLLPLNELWRALTTGTDNNPPLLYLPVGVLLRAIHKAELAVRLPSTLALLVACWCLFRIAQPYASRPFAIAAAFVPWTTFLVAYGAEGRPYACAVCFAALALYFWQQLILLSPGSTVNLIGLALSIAGALSSHFSSTLLVAALAAGELVRWMVQRRIDWLVMLSLVGGCVPLLIFLPILHALKVVLAGSAFWAIPTIHKVYIDTKEALTPARALLLVIVAAIVLRRHRFAPERPARAPVYELIAWLVLLCAPMEGYLQSRFTGAFAIRYALVMVLPFSLAVTLVCDRLSRGSAAAAILVVGLCTILGVREARRVGQDYTNPYPQFQQSFAAKLPPHEPVVVGTPLLFLPLHYYAAEPLRSRLLYLTAPDLALKLSGTNTPDVNIGHLSGFAPVPQIPYRTFLARRERFLVLMKETDHFTWLGRQLANDGVAVQKIACAAIGCLYQAEPR